MSLKCEYCGSADHATGGAVDACLVRLAAQKKELVDNIDYLLDHYPDAVRVREGNGPENLAASLAVSWQKLQSEFNIQTVAGRQMLAELGAVLKCFPEWENHYLDRAAIYVRLAVDERNRLRTELAETKSFCNALFELAKTFLPACDNTARKLWDIALERGQALAAQFKRDALAERDAQWALALEPLTGSHSMSPETAAARVGITVDQAISRTLRFAAKSQPTQDKLNAMAATIERGESWRPPIPTP